MGERLRSVDVVAMLRFVHQIRSADEPGAFRREVLCGLRQLVGAENAGYNDIEFETQRVAWVDDPVGVSHFPGSEVILSAHLFENPLATHYARGADDRCLKISDFMSLRAFKKTTVYNEFYRRIDTDRQLAFVSSGTRSSTAIVLHRRGRDFSERDRAILTGLRPHIIQAHHAVHRLSQLYADIASVTDGMGSMHVGLMMLDEEGKVHLATARARQLIATYFGVGRCPVGTLPDMLDAWLRRQGSDSPRDGVPAVRAPYVVQREDRCLVVRLFGEHPRRLISFSEERCGADRRVLEAYGLTPREADVAKWLAEGKRDHEIAVILGISPRTVQHHVERIYEKLGVETRTAAVAAALRLSSESVRS